MKQRKAIASTRNELNKKTAELVARSDDYAKSAGRPVEWSCDVEIAARNYTALHADVEQLRVRLDEEEAQVAKKAAPMNKLYANMGVSIGTKK